MPSRRRSSRSGSGAVPPHAPAWLVRTTVHRSLHARRGAERRRRWEGRASSEPAGSCPLCDPEAQLLEREGRAEMVRALDSLCQEQRRVVELRVLEGLAYHEIAEKLAIPIGTVRSRLNRARLAVEQWAARAGRREGRACGGSSPNP